MGTTIRTSFFALLVLFIADCLNATPISYVGPSSNGTMTGWWAGNVWYANVTEDNDEDNGDTAMLFGAPTGTTGTSINFSPQGFIANSENADSGPVIVDSQLSFMVIAGQGAVINNFQFEEFGDTTLARGFDDTLDAFTEIEASFIVSIVEIDNVLLPIPVTVTGSMTFSPSDGDYQLSVDAPTDLSYTEIFEGSVFFDIDQILADEGLSYQFGATKLNVTLDNTLTAISEVGTEAFIKKKVANGITITTNVPEPSSAILVLLAISGAAVARRS